MLGGIVISTKTELDSISFTIPTIEDGKGMWELCNRISPELDMNSPYKYTILCEYFPNYCVVAKKNEEVVGFITGFTTPEKSDTLFVWQIGIDRSERGKGLGIQLLTQLVKQQKTDEQLYVEATITPSNKASQSLFQRLAKTFNTDFTGRPLIKENMFPAGQSHEEEWLYRIGPIEVIN